MWMSKIKDKALMANSMENSVPRSAIHDPKDFNSTKASQFKTGFRDVFDQFFE